VWISRLCDALRASMCLPLLSFFFYTGPATTEIYTLSLHDALPISGLRIGTAGQRGQGCRERCAVVIKQRLFADQQEAPAAGEQRSEEHTSELQSRENLVCRLLLEKKKKAQQAILRD